MLPLLLPSQVAVHPAHGAEYSDTQVIESSQQHPPSHSLEPKQAAPPGSSGYGETPSQGPQGSPVQESITCSSNCVLGSPSSHGADSVGPLHAGIGMKSH